jgi:hypothetical protein
MDANERERLTKAHHAAQFLAANLREVMTKTDSVSLEILATDMIVQVTKMSQRLHRLADAETP